MGSAHPGSASDMSYLYVSTCVLFLMLIVIGIVYLLRGAPGWMIFFCMCAVVALAIASTFVLPS